MKQFGIKTEDGFELVSLLETAPDLDGPYDVRQLCPDGRFWEESPRAPWNAFWSANRADWEAEFPDSGFEELAADDPTAPWNRPEPSRVPADYPGLLWAPPQRLDLVKLPKPEEPIGQKAEPYVELAEDGQSVERRWNLVPLSAAELREHHRATLRTSWAAQPSWIRGPFGDKFEIAGKLLDVHDDTAAADLIRYAEAPSGYSATYDHNGTTVDQIAYFTQLKQQLVAAIEALPA